MCTKLKAILMAIILAGFASQQAAAENFNDEEIAFAFGDSTIAESAEMVLLSNEEMMATEGNFGPLLGFVFRIVVVDFALQRTINSYVQTMDAID